MQIAESSIHVNLTYYIIARVTLKARDQYPSKESVIQVGLPCPFIALHPLINGDHLIKVSTLLNPQDLKVWLDI